MAKAMHRKITAKEAEEIRSFAKEKESAFKVPCTVSLPSDLDMWLHMLSRKLGVSKSALIRYFVAESRKEIELGERVERIRKIATQMERRKAEIRNQQKDV